MPAETAFFGTGSIEDEFSISHEIDTAELQDGLSITNHIKTIQLRMEKRAQLCDAYGIAASDNLSRNTMGLIIDSASWSLEELVSTPCMNTHPDFVPGGDGSGWVEPDFTKVLQYYDQHLFLGVNESISVSCKWRDPSELSTLATKMLTPGKHIDEAFIIGPAASVATTPANNIIGYSTYSAGAPWPFISLGNPNSDRSLMFYVSDVKKTQSEEWHTAEIELTRRVGITDPADTDTSPLQGMLYLFGTLPANWKPDSSWMGYTIGDITMFQLSISLSLSAGANAELTESMTVFPTDPSDPLLSLT